MVDNTPGSTPTPISAPGNADDFDAGKYGANEYGQAFNHMGYTERDMYGDPNLTPTGQQGEEELQRQHETNAPVSFEDWASSQAKYTIPSQLHTMLHSALWLQSIAKYGEMPQSWDDDPRMKKGADDAMAQQKNIGAQEKETGEVLGGSGQHWGLDLGLQASELLVGGEAALPFKIGERIGGGLEGLNKGTNMLANRFFPNTVASKAIGKYAQQFAGVGGRLTRAAGAEVPISAALAAQQSLTLDENGNGVYNPKVFGESMFMNMAMGAGIGYGADALLNRSSATILKKDIDKAATTKHYIDEAKDKLSDQDKTDTEQDIDDAQKVVDDVVKSPVGGYTEVPAAKVTERAGSIRSTDDVTQDLNVQDIENGVGLESWQQAVRGFDEGSMTIDGVEHQVRVDGEINPVIINHQGDIEAGIKGTEETLAAARTEKFLLTQHIKSNKGGDLIAGKSPEELGFGSSPYMNKGTKEDAAAYAKQQSLSKDIDLAESKGEDTSALKEELAKHKAEHPPHGHMTLTFQDFGRSEGVYNTLKAAADKGDTNATAAIGIMDRSRPELLKESLATLKKQRRLIELARANFGEADLSGAQEILEKAGILAAKASPELSDHLSSLFVQMHDPANKERVDSLIACLWSNL
jgi:hypothetical protein